MDWKLLLTNSILLGVGLAIDAFSVSVADTMAEPHMARSKKLLIASVFAIFQTLMPLMGWFFVRAAAERFLVFQKAIPYIALLLLLYLGFKMIMESRKSEEDNEKKAIHPYSSCNPYPRSCNQHRRLVCRFCNFLLLHTSGHSLHSHHRYRHPNNLRLGPGSRKEGWKRILKQGYLDRRNHPHGNWSGDLRRGSILLKKSSLPFSDKEPFGIKKA